MKIFLEPRVRKYDILSIPSPWLEEIFGLSRNRRRSQQRVRRLEYFF